MKTLPLNEPAGVLVKTTCVDFPGHVAGSFFLKGCNLRCPYCYNVALVEQTLQSNIALASVEELFAHLEKRQGILSGVVISGGEPLLNPYTPIIIKKAKELGYLVKIDTNGTLPDKLELILSEPQLCPDFVAMDIKTSPARYGIELCNHNYEKELKKSIDLIAALPTAAREYRTVLVPPLVTKTDIKNIAELLPADASWQFAQFQNKNCLNPAYNEITPYTDSEIKELVEYAKSFIKGSQLR